MDNQRVLLILSLCSAFHAILGMVVYWPSAWLPEQMYVVKRWTVVISLIFTILNAANLYFREDWWLPFIFVYAVIVNISTACGVAAAYYWYQWNKQEAVE